jgi:BirA family biotin operon repressor/biotin-[acetyl-CoA-carboxylase] ligase
MRITAFLLPALALTLTLSRRERGPTEGEDAIDLNRILQTTFVAAAEYHPTLASTSDLAARIAREQSPAMPLLIVAGGQTAGRGRGAKCWWTGPGSLAFSLLLDPGPAMIALAAGVAVADALAPLLRAETIGIRWPNDVMAGRRKLAGILVEVLPDGRAVVGIGVNTNNTAADAPAELQDRIATLRDLSGQAHDQTGVLAAVLQAFERRLAEARSVPERLAARADALCADRGRLLRVEQGAELVSGRCLGIAPDGALLLETPTGPRAIHSGTVLRE